MTSSGWVDRARVDYETVARLVTWGAPIATVLATLAVYLAGLQTFAIVSLYVTVPVVVATAVAAVASRRLGDRRTAAATERAGTVTVPSALSRARFRLATAGYLVVLGAALLVVSEATVRPYSFYLLTAVATAVVLYQALNAGQRRSRVGVVLAETGVLLATLVWSVTLKYAYYFGRTDVFPHHALVDSLLSTGHVTGAFGEYQAFPLWQVLTAVQQQLYGGEVGTLTVFFVTTGVLYAVVPTGVYAVARRLSFPTDVSLVAALGTVLVPYVLIYGMYAIPRSVTSVLVLPALLGLLLDSRRGSLLFVAVVVATAVYHTITLPFVFVTLGAYYVAERVLATGDGTGGHDSEGASYVVPTWALLLVPVVQLVYWGLAAPSLIERVVGLVVDNTTYGLESQTGALADQFVESPFRELANYASLGFLLLFVVFGVVRAPWVDRFSRRTGAVLLATMLLAVVSFPGPVLLVSVVSNVTADMALRFAQYTYPFVAVAVGIGVVAAVRTGTSLGRRRVAVAVVLVLVCSTAFLTVSNDFVASDNPLVERDDFYTFYLSESEVTGFQTVTDRAGTPVTSDYVTCRYVNNPGGGECGIIQANPIAGELYVEAGSVVVLRDGELAERPLSVFPTSEHVESPAFSNFRESIAADSPVWEDLREHNRVYDDGTVSAYTVSDTAQSANSTA